MILHLSCHCVCVGGGGACVKAGSRGHTYGVGDGVWVPGRTGVLRLGSHVFTLWAILPALSWPFPACSHNDVSFEACFTSCFFPDTGHNLQLFLLCRSVTVFLSKLQTRAITTRVDGYCLGTSNNHDDLAELSLSTPTEKDFCPVVPSPEQVCSFLTCLLEWAVALSPSYPSRTLSIILSLPLGLPNPQWILLPVWSSNRCDTWLFHPGQRLSHSAVWKLLVP